MIRKFATLCRRSQFSKAIKPSNFSTKKKIDPDPPIPEDFYDEAVEIEKEFFDIASVRAHKIETITITPQASLTWDEIENNEVDDEDDAIFSAPLEEEVEINDADDIDNEDEDDEDADQAIATAIFADPNSQQSGLINAFNVDDLSDHIEDFDDTVMFFPEEMLNYHHPWRKTEEYPDEYLEPFIPDTSPEKFRFDQQGDRACVGKRQRSGLNGILKCHKIDLHALSYLDVMTLRNFLSTDSEILRRTQTGLCAKCQRKVAKTIKQARNFGLLPHIGEFMINDSRQESEGKSFHDSVEGPKVVPEIELIVSTEMKVRHIGFLKFKSEVTQFQIDDVFIMLRNLKDLIPGLLDFSGGEYSSPEGLNKGFTHAFEMTFESETFRDQYFPHPEHEKVKNVIVALIDDLVVFDYKF